MMKVKLFGGKNSNDEKKLDRIYSQSLKRLSGKYKTQMKTVKNTNDENLVFGEQQSSMTTKIFFHFFS